MKSGHAGNLGVFLEIECLSTTGATAPTSPSFATVLAPFPATGNSLDGSYKAMSCYSRASRTVPTGREMEKRLLSSPFPTGCGGIQDHRLVPSSLLTR